MASDGDSIWIVARTARERDLEPLLEESVVTLELDGEGAAKLEAHLQYGWLLGVKMGHKAIADSKGGKWDPMGALHSMRDEFEDSMHALGDALNMTVDKTLVAWGYLENAWTAGAQFWETEITARSIESEAGDIGEALRRLADEEG